MENKVYKAFLDKDLYIFQCPNCEEWVQVGINEVNCAIFRHGYYFVKTPQGNIIPTEMVNPHTPKTVCEALIAEKKICGCGKPFKMIKEEQGYRIEICDYL